jgi:hypothetical protein
MIPFIFLVLGCVCMAVAGWMLTTNARLKMWDFVTVACPVGVLAMACLSIYLAYYTAQ